MYVKRIVLENVRSFERLDFDLARPDGGYAGWTVITGDNASGKTTLLKALSAVLVGPDAFRALQPSLRGWIRQGQPEAVIAAEVVASEGDGFAAGRRYAKPFWSELRLSTNGGPEPSLNPGKKYRKTGLGPTHGPWADNPIRWFCAGYGPFRRLYGASPDAQRVMLGPGRIARFATVFREDSTLGECELWIKELHHRQLENRPRETTLLASIQKVLNDDFLQNGLRIERVDSEGVWLKHQNGATLPLADMSDGYRAALAMLIDIMRHLADVYEDRELVQDQGGAYIVPHPGVVLIDEVDSHLHPEWQRQLGFWLKKKLPSIQFIVTTHSPIICQAADKNGVFHLPPPGSAAQPFKLGEEDYQRIIAGKPDAIYVSPAFGMRNTRSPLAVRNRGRYSGLRAKEAAGLLTRQERQEKEQLKLWANIDNEDPTANA